MTPPRSPFDDDDEDCCYMEKYANGVANGHDTIDKFFSTDFATNQNIIRLIGCFFVVVKGNCFAVCLLRRAYELWNK